MFFITHSIEEAVFLGDRVYIMSTGPGPIVKELEIEPADRPALEMAREPRFQETVYYIRDLIAQLEEKPMSEPMAYMLQTPCCPRVTRANRQIPQSGVSEPLEPAGVPGGHGVCAVVAARTCVLPVVAAGEIAYWACSARIPSFKRTSKPRRRRRPGPQHRSRAANARANHLLAAQGTARSFHGAARRVAWSCSRLPPSCKQPSHDELPIAVGKLSDRRAGSAAVDSLAAAVHAVRALSLPQANQRRANSGRHQAAGAKLAELPAAGANDKQQRVRKALEDNLQTSRDRLANLQRARDNFELVKLEIDRLENKIRSLSELAVNRQEPDYISGQVDQVAASMMETEKTMNELQIRHRPRYGR